MRTIVGLGDGQAMDVAKFFSWSLGNALLFHIPSAVPIQTFFARLDWQEAVRNGNFQSGNFHLGNFH